MVMKHNKEELLDFIGYDPEVANKCSLPSDLQELSMSSLKAFMDEHALQHSSESSALIHITGPSVVGNSAPIKAVGEFMTGLQSVFDSIGASLSGRKNAGGTIPAQLSSRTQLSLVASPMPGSVILEIAPTMPRLEDLQPDGEPLFDITEFGYKPLADMAFDELSSLLSELKVDSPDNEAFVSHLAELGPRAASSMQSLCEKIDKESLDVDFEWKEPTAERHKVALSHSLAKYVATVIKDADINSELLTIEGVLLTSTLSEKDRLRVRETLESGAFKDHVVQIGDIPLEEIHAVTTGDKVRVTFDQRTSMKAGQRTTIKLLGVSIAKVETLDGL